MLRDHNSLEYKRAGYEIARTQLAIKDQSRRQLEVLEEMQARKHEETAREPKQARQEAGKQCTQRQ